MLYIMCICVCMCVCVCVCMCVCRTHLDNIESQTMQTVALFANYENGVYVDNWCDVMKCSPMMLYILEYS